MPEPSPAFELPLFPLRSVLFPGGLLTLKVFEARYLDLVSDCLREGRPFGVVGLRQGQEVRRLDDAVALEPIGTLAELLTVDSPQPGILHVRCKGTHRFATHTPTQLADGLWVAQACVLPADAVLAPDAALLPTVRALAQAISALKAQRSLPFLTPLAFDDAGWVANRWCEILPIPPAAQQQLMTLDDPMARLRLVDQFLRSKGVVG